MSRQDNAEIWSGIADRNRANANNQNLNPTQRREAAQATREAERMARKDRRDAYKHGEYDPQ